MVSALELAEQLYRRAGARAYVLGVAALTGLATGCGATDGGEEESHPWANQTFLVDMPETSWIKPDVGDVLEGFVPQFLLGFGDAMGDTLNVTLGTAIGNVQDPCGPTLQTTAQAAVPAFNLGPVTLPIQVDHKRPEEMVTVNATIHRLTLVNVIPAGAGASAAGQMTAEVDLRDLYPLFQAGLEPAENAEEACAAFGDRATCEPCTSDQQPVCLMLEAGYLSAVPFAGTVTPIEASVITSPACPLRSRPL